MKQLKDQEPKTVTLKHIVSRAKKDKAFFNSLVKAPKTTLNNNALMLSEADGKKLTSLAAKYRSAKIKTDKIGPSTTPEWFE